jgi:hypothetical protein
MIHLSYHINAGLGWGGGRVGDDVERKILEIFFFTNRSKNNETLMTILFILHLRNVNDYWPYWTFVVVSLNITWALLIKNLLLRGWV